MNRTIKTLQNRITNINSGIVETNRNIEALTHNLTLEKKYLKEFNEELESINKSIKILDSK